MSERASKYRIVKMSINSEQASGSWSISDHSEPAKKNNNRSTDMEILDLTMNNRIEPSPLVMRPPNSVPNFRNIRKEFITHDNSDNHSVNSINSKIVESEVPRYKKINEIVRILPEFNGKNISINSFIRDCKEAETFVNPGDKSFFLKVVKSRVTGDVNDYLQFKSFHDLDQLLSELKRVFAPTQNLPQLQTDLARVRQKSQDSDRSESSGTDKREFQSYCGSGNDRRNG